MEGDYTDAEKMMHQKNKEALQAKQLKDKNRALAKREDEREMLRKKKQLMQMNSFNIASMHPANESLEEAKKNDGAVSINPKVGGSCKKCGGMMVDDECECCGKKEKMEEGMTLKDFKANRRKLKRREASADAKKRGHVGKEWYNSGQTYSPDQAKRMRSKLDDAERRTRHRTAVDPDNEDDNNYSADKTKNPKKLRKQKAMGEQTILEKAPPGDKFERMVKHIKAKYKKGGLTDVEKRKAYGAAWKVYNAEEVETLDELNRAEKETGINTKTGKPTQTGGAKDDKAFTSVKRMMRGMEGKPAGQRKKVPGKKPPAAGEYGAPRSPAQKVAMRRAAAKRSQDNMSSRFD